MNMKQKLLPGLMMAVMLVGIFVGMVTNAQADTSSQSIDFDLSSQSPKTYGDTAFALTATASSGLPVSYASSNPAVAIVSGNMINIIGAGTTIITASQGGDGTFDAATPVAQLLTVNKKPVTVTAVAYSKIYGNGVSIPYVSSPSNLVAGDYFYGALGRVMGEIVGQYLVNVGNLCVMTPGKLCNDNYNLTFDPAPVYFTILPRPITVTADAKSKAWNDPDPALTFQITSGNFTFADYIVSGNLITDNHFSGELARVAGEEVGPYAINQNTLALSTNYTLTYVPSNMTITKATPIITSVPTASRILDGQALSASTLASGAASVLGSFAFTTPDTIPPAGSYSAAITFTPTDATHYNTVSGSVTVAVGMPGSVRIKRGATVLGPYSFIEDAFAVPLIDGDKIEMWGIDHFLGERLFNSDIEITLKGGFEASYGDYNPGPNSILHGTLTVKQGTLKVEKVVLRLMQ